jgi:DNA-binding MarR family transcriptional regulator
LLQQLFGDIIFDMSRVTDNADVVSKGVPFDSLEQEAYLALWRTYDSLKAIEDALFSEWNLSAQQYNILRLLQAASPDAVPTLSLTRKLISRAPDVTRMLDRLESNGWIERERSTTDRRTVYVSITKAGTKLLDQLFQPLQRCHQKQIGHLTKQQLKQLCDLLEKVRAPHVTHPNEIETKRR